MINHNEKSQAIYIAWRFYLIIFFILAAVAGLSWRVFDLAILDQPFLRKQGDERVLRLVNKPAFRGMIVDRNGFPLAVSTPVYSAWINPREFAPDTNELSALSKLLNMSPKDIQSLDKQKKTRAFAYLKRSLSPEQAQKIKVLNITGVYTQKEYRRYYPEGEITSHIIGFTNIDDRGQEGLELAYDKWLTGEAGKKWVIKDRYGQVISNVQTIQDQTPGRDLVLSIDRRIQYLAYRELLAGVKEYKAAAGTAIVLDVKTGEILAMANVPSYNPNNRATYKKENMRNRALTDTFEPGSTIKAFTIAAALEKGRYKPNSVINTSPGWMRLDHHIVKDEEDNGLMTISKILRISSNMGAAKIVLSMPANTLWNFLHKMGFGDNVGLYFPGEQMGTLTKHNPWGAFTLATLSFGYGMSATPMQLVRAYSIFADDGIKKPISMLKVNKVPEGEKVLDSKVAKQMLAMMEAVVSRSGTARKAFVPGYRVAGKTGTAKKVGPTGYLKHRYNSSFVGIAPLTNPRVIVAVIMLDPRGKFYYAGDVSGPVFAKVMEGTLRLLDVPPDAPITAQN